MEYIDAEKLRAEIERRQEERQDIRDSASLENEYWAEGEFSTRDDEDDAILSIITSLQQEQQDVDLEKEIVIQWSKCNPTDEGVGSEYAIITVEQFDAIARHFCELGRKQVLQEIYDGKTKPVDKITAAWLDDKEKENK